MRSGEIEESRILSFLPTKINWKKIELSDLSSCPKRKILVLSSP